MFELYIQFDDGNVVHYSNVTDFKVVSDEDNLPVLTIITESFEMTFQMHGIRVFTYSYFKE